MVDGTLEVGMVLYFDRSLVEGFTPAQTGLRNGAYTVAEVETVAGRPCVRLNNSLGDDRFYGPEWFIQRSESS